MPPDLNGSIPETLVENIENETSPLPTQEDFSNRKRKSKPNKSQRKRMKLMKEEQIKQLPTSTPDLNEEQIPSQESVNDHDYAKSSEVIDNYEAKLEALKQQFQKEKFEQRLKFEKEKLLLRTEKNQLQTALRKAKRDINNLTDETSNKGKARIDGIVRKRLDKHFSEAQLDLILDKTKEYSKKWCNQDFKFAMLVKMISPKVLKLLRKNKVLPLPSDSTLKKKFSFMYVTQGYVHPSLEYFKKLVPRMKKGEELACLSFDEMKLVERAQWDRKIDAVIGPHKQAQVFMLRSLIGDWKLPVYVEFDTKVTKSLLLQIIFQIEMIGIKVMITTCDQAGGNQGLAKSLGIFPSKKTSEELGVDHDPENVSFTNPWDNERQVLFAFDWIHAFKNLRNHMLDDEMTIKKGKTIRREDLLTIKGKTEIRGAFKLDDIHFYCKQQDRQRVSLARDLLSKRSAMMYKALHPNEEKFQLLGEFIETVDECFNILTSQKMYDNDPLKCALEVHLEKQLKPLEKLVKYMKTIKWSGRPRFNKAIIIAIKCAIELQKMLAEIHGIPNLMTENITQDFLESFFSVIRAMMWANNNPTALMFLQRLKYYVTEKILEDDDFDIFTLKEILEEARDLSDMDEDFPIIETDTSVDIYEDIPDLVELFDEGQKNQEQKTEEQKNEEQEVDDSDDFLFDLDDDIEKDEEVLEPEVVEKLNKLQKIETIDDPSYHIGTDWIAASIASKFREDKSLGTTEIKMKAPKGLEQISTMFTHSLSKGGYLRPTEQWFSDCTLMDKMFIVHHPTGRVRKGTGVTADFTKKLVQNFPERNEKILSYYCRLRNGIRIREMNAKRLAPKRGTLRNRKKLAEY